MVDLQAYDCDDNLLQARIRSYDSPANATAAASVSPSAYLTGLRFTWQVDATYSGGNLSKYSIIRLP